MRRQTDRWPPDPINRQQSEVMFGLRMTLNFTGTMSVALGAGATVREILLAARGCNIAWGPVDATVCLLTSATEHGRGRAQAAAIRAASDTQAKAQLRALPGRVGEALSDAQVGAVLGWVRDTPPEPDVEPVLQRQDFIAAGQVFLPVTGALPFPRSCRFLSLNRCRWRCACQMRSRLQCSLSLAGGWINRCRAGGV